MKKLKLFLPVLVSVFMAFVLCFSVACNPDTDKDDDDNTDIGDDVEQVEPASDEWTLESITLGGEVKTEYALNYSGNIDVANLTVTAKLVNVEDGKDKTEDVTSSAVVNSSEFNPNVVGEYDIYVSYTREKVTRSASYTVSVKGTGVSVGGLEIVKTKTVYDIAAEPYTVEINLDDITVYDIGEDGERGDELTSEDYTLKFYKGAEAQENLSAATAGVYTVVAEKVSDKSTSFVKVIVRDPAEKIEHVSENAVLTQQQSLTDDISADWTYKLTRKSGAVETVTASGVKLSKVSTLVPGGYTTTATYTEVAYGDDGTAKVISQSTDINYTITKNEEFTLKQYAANFESFTPKVIEAGSELINYKYENAPVTLMPGTNKSEIVECNISYTNTSENINKKFTRRLKFNGASSASNLRYIKVELEGPSLLTVVAASGSSSTERGVVLYGSDKNGNVDTSNVLSKQGVKTVTKLDFIVEEKGSYYIGVDASILFYYVQIDTFLMDDDAEELLLPTETADTIGATRGAEAQEYYAVGATTVNSTGVTVTKYSTNLATCECTETDISDDASLTYAFTEALTAEMIGTEQTVTVTYGQQTATYKIKVTTADGIYSVAEPALKAAYTLPTASATTVEIDLSEVYTLKTVTAEGEGTVTATEVKVTDAQNAEQTITDNKVSLAKGEYTVTIKYTNGKTWTFEKAITVSDYVAPSDQPVTVTQTLDIANLDAIDTTAKIEFTVNGEGTGFFAIPKSANTDITISTQNSLPVIKLNGAAVVTSKTNVINFTVGAGKTIITVSYFQSSADRYLVIFGAGFEQIETSDKPTTADKAVKTATIELDLTADETEIYIGSVNKGIYISGLTVTTVTESTAPETPEDVIINISDVEAATLTAATELIENSGVFGLSGIVIETDNKSADGLTFTKRLKLGGKGTQTQKSLKFVVEGAATITVYAITGSSSSLDRTLSLYDDTFTLIEGSTTSGVPNAITKFTFSVSEAGEYYLGGTNGINLYYISVTY